MKRRHGPHGVARALLVAALAIAGLASLAGPGPNRALAASGVAAREAVARRKTAVRKRPKGRAKRVAYLSKGQKVEVLQVVGPWVRVRVGPKKTGWVPKRRVKLVVAATEGEPTPGAEPPAPEKAPPANEPPGVGGSRSKPKGEAEGTQRLRLAVYTLKAQGGFEPRVAELVTDALVSEVRKLNRASTIGMGEIQDMLSHAERKRMLGCEADECLVEIGGALGVDFILTGSIGKLGDSHLLNLRLIDVANMSVKRSVNRRLKGGGDGEEFLEAVGLAVENLFPDRPLRAGFERGADAEIARRLNPPPLAPHWFWATAGASLGAAAAGLGFALATNAAQKDWDDLVERSRTEDVNAEEFARIDERLDSRSRLTNILLVSSGGLALGAGVMALFTDWKDYRLEAESKVSPVGWLSPDGTRWVGFAGSW